MECRTCRSSDRFRVHLSRVVDVSTLGGSILEASPGYEELARSGQFQCVECGSHDVDATNDDIDGFWKSMRVVRREAAAASPADAGNLEDGEADE